MAEFSTEIHPLFSRIPDIQFAQAASELLLRMGEFKYVGRGSASDFPPEPSNLEAMQLAYIESGDSGEHVRRQFLTLGDNRRTTTDFSNAYAKDMRVIESVTPNTREASTSAEAEFLAIAPNISRRAGLRTVASYVLFRSIRSEKTSYGGLFVPKITMEQGPLEFRSIFISVMGQAGGKQELTEKYHEYGGSSDEMIDDIFKLQNAALSAGAVLAGIHLPRIELVREMTRRRTAPSPQQGLNREQRRALRKHQK